MAGPHLNGKREQTVECTGSRNEEKETCKAREESEERDKNKTKERSKEMTRTQTPKCMPSSLDMRDLWSVTT